MLQLQVMIFFKLNALFKYANSFARVTHMLAIETMQIINAVKIQCKTIIRIQCRPTLGHQRV